MKKTVIVNINGIIFHIDEDAYGMLNTYLDALHRYFDSQTEGKEIVSDIESRIAELLQPLITEIKQSVTIDDIEGIVATLGKPEDIAGEDTPIEEEKKEPRQTHDSSHRNSRRLYRDPDNSIISGVSSGIAAYFDIDPILVRILFVALIFAGGVSFIIYPILWIVLPQAQTAAQKLEMRGENVTINNIERTYHTTDHVDPNSFWGRTRSMINELFGLFGKVFYAVWRVFSFFLGLFLILISLAIIISLIAATFFNKFYIDAIASSSAISVKEFLNLIISPGETSWLLIVMLIVIFIPLIGLIYAGLKLIIRFKAKDKWAMLTMFLIWIAGIVVAAILVFSQINNFRLWGYAKETVSLSVPKSNTIYLNMPYPAEHDEIYRMRTPPPGLFGIKIKDNKKELWGINRIEIERSSKNYPELEIIREARGFSFEEANEAAKLIKVNYTQTDSSLTIEPAFWIDQSKWKFQKVRIILHIPMNMKLNLNENTRHFLSNNWRWRRDFIGKTLVMDEDGLRTDYIANSIKTYNNVIIVKVSPSIKNPKIDSILRKNKSPKIQIISDSGKFLLQRPIIIFKSWNKDYVNCKPVVTYGRRIKCNYDYDERTNTLYLPSYAFSQLDIRTRNLLANSNGHFPAKFEVSVPEGARLYFSKEVNDYLQSKDQQMVGGTWQITNKGFTQITKK